jgi:hypothetical protein
MLQRLAEDSANMTVQHCLDLCSGSKYAGLQYARECWCGDLDLAGDSGAVPGALVDNSECSTTCAGDASQFCGAGQRMTTYVLEDVCVEL